MEIKHLPALPCPSVPSKICVESIDAPGVQLAAIFPNEVSRLLAANQKCWNWMDIAQTQRKMLGNQGKSKQIWAQRQKKNETHRSKGSPCFS